MSRKPEPESSMDSLFFIGGPCVIEGEAHALRHAKAIAEICGSLGVPYIYKSSYDKANRTSGRTFRGPGLKAGLKILAKVKKLGLRVLTDVHSPEEAREAAKVVDVLQVPAMLCRQTDLVLAAAKTGRTVNIKKGQFMDPWSMKNIYEKATSTGNRNVMLTERGTTFGYGHLVVDMRAIPVMKSFGCKVVMDAGHAVQQPGGRATPRAGCAR
jgi:2-dehydro-3-deoxyphosphooctonate aldolase (KDO 8-P synthase)